MSSAAPTDVAATPTPAAAEAGSVAGDTTYVFQINMSCDGCSGAVDRVLKKLDGVSSYEVSLKTQSARVTTGPGLEYAKVLEVIKKTGKTVTGAVQKGEEGGEDVKMDV